MIGDDGDGDISRDLLGCSQGFLAYSLLYTSFEEM